MKIIQLTAENIKKLKVIDITPKGDFIQVTGKNGSGKTSVLDAIWWALAGKDSIQGEPIRKGQEKAVIKLNLGDIVITRRFTKAGTTLVVENADGFRAASPQAMLDALIGHFTFDPLEFSRMGAKDQFDTLKRIADVKIDFAAVKKQDDEYREKRANINREVKLLEGQVSGITVAEDAPDAPVSVSELMAQLKAAEETNGVLREEEIKLENAHAQIAIGEKDLQGLRERMKVCEAHIAEARAFISNFGEIKYLSTDHIKEQISGAEAVNKKHADKKRKGELNGQIALKQKHSEELTQLLEARAKSLHEEIQKANMPIPGLSLGENAVMFNSIPFDQLSAAEQLRVSVAIAMAANPKLKIIRIKDGSLLDDASLKMIKESTHEKGYQMWVETVNSSGKVGIYLEDGEIVADNMESDDAESEKQTKTG